MTTVDPIWTDLPDRPQPKAGTLVAWLIGPAFLAMAGWFAFLSPKAEVPIAQMALVARDQFAPGARRHPMGDPPSVVVGGFTHSCNECHSLFDSPPVERRTLMQHTHIVFDHGMNNRCFNCHDRRDREKLVLHDGTKIGFNDVPRLCSQCHGTVFRDWQNGTHGKTLGSWSAASTNPPQRRLTCNECHDPHSPAYKPIQPLPGPHTLRMGDQTPVESDPAREHHRPLRRWPAPAHDAQGEKGGRP